ncbi:MAG: YfiR family protein [Bacteroidia bacterium]
MKKTALIVFAYLLLTAFQQREDIAAMNAKYKTIYLYSFTKYIEWPPDYKDGNFVIGVCGPQGPLLAELNRMASTKTAGSQKIEIRTVSNIEGAGKCHILFLPTENIAQFADIGMKLKGHGTLLVTEKEGMIKKGSAVNFVMVDSKIKFQLSKINAEKQKLKISHELEALAVNNE